ncbi:TPA: hypothetical protein ACQZHW_003030 [Enterobacter hormaechei]
MLYVDIPGREEFSHLSDIRSDACVSIYLGTSPIRQNLDASKIQLGNFIKEALQQVEEKGVDKRRLAMLEEELCSVLEDVEFWVATPEASPFWRHRKALRLTV